MTGALVSNEHNPRGMNTWPAVPTRKANMSAEPATQSPAAKGFQGLKPEAITFWQGVAIIFGANIGAGILSLPYGSREGGIPTLVTALIIAGVLTTVSMLYVAEVALRTSTPLQLSGLARKYLGNVGSWLIFAGVAINGLGALIAYTTGSGSILAQLLGVPESVGSLLFFIPSVIVVWLGLKATGRSEQVVTVAMFVMIMALILWTVFGPGLESSNLLYANPYFIIPTINLVVFGYIAQYTVPELARGLAKKANPKVLPRAIVAGMSATGFLLVLVPLAAIGSLGRDNLSEVVTLAWGESLGPAATWLANGFALLAMLTSFWAIGLTLMTNILDRFNWPATNAPRYRVAALALVALPPFIIGVFGLTGFVAALGYTGAFAGAIMSAVPVLMLRKARKYGDVEPRWQAGRIAHPAMQFTLVAVFGLAFLYSIASVFGAVPTGW